MLSAHHNTAASKSCRPEHPFHNFILFILPLDLRVQLFSLSLAIFCSCAHAHFVAGSTPEWFSVEIPCLSGWAPYPQLHALFGFLFLMLFLILSRAPVALAEVCYKNLNSIDHLMKCREDVAIILLGFLWNITGEPPGIPTGHRNEVTQAVTITSPCSPQAAHSCVCSPLWSQKKPPKGCSHFQVPLNYQLCLLTKIAARNYFLDTDICLRPGYNRQASKNSNGNSRQNKRERDLCEVWFPEMLSTCSLYQLQQLVLCTSAETKSSMHRARNWIWTKGCVAL